MTAYHCSKHGGFKRDCVKCHAVKRLSRCSAHGNIKKSCPLCHPPAPIDLLPTDPYERYFLSSFIHRVQWNGDCWQWLGTKAGHSKEGLYGVVQLNGKKMAAHRFAYQFFVGPVGDDYSVHHICENTLCVNPQHLQKVEPACHTSHHIREAAFTRWQSIAACCDRSQLTDRQQEILYLIGERLTTNEIAAALSLSIKGVEFHKTAIKKTVQAQKVSA